LIQAFCELKAKYPSHEFPAAEDRARISSEADAPRAVNEKVRSLAGDALDDVFDDPHQPAKLLVEAARLL
jgi:hypothetical protein